MEIYTQRPGCEGVDCKSISRTQRIGHIDVVNCASGVAIDFVRRCVIEKCKARISFCNANTVLIAERNEKLRKRVGDLIFFNDGIAVDAASFILYGHMFIENLNGTDLIPRILGSFTEPVKVALIGGKEGVAERAAVNISSAFSLVDIEFLSHGFVTDEELTSVSDKLNEIGVQLVLLGMGQPKQELAAITALANVNAVVICVGAFLDFVSGHVPRAPKLVRVIRFEWLFRLLIEPQRMFPRYVPGAIAFGSLVWRQLWARLKK